MTDRRHLLAAALALPVLWPARVRAAPERLRIGYQKSSTLMIWLKSRGTLETALAPLDVDVSWHEFTSGLPLLEALNVGAVDVSSDVADAVPPFALAAGARLSCWATEAPSPQAQALVVRADSGLARVAQLKGRKVGFAKGAGAHYLVLAALKRAGLSMRDIEPAYLSPADARAAFERGDIAAWAIWDPFLAAVQRQSGARLLTESVGLSDYRRFYLAGSAFAQRRGDVLGVLFAELLRAGAWIKRNPDAAAQWHAPVIGLDAATVAAANARRSYQVQPVDADGLADLQRIADAFTNEGVLPRKVHLAELGVWRAQP
ncbi:aliphatic sulfonate ABC transporter substrate-binding protein [Azohydromonas aeria]|uniref:aliphatic sulfonate ABC transporter substrate-binding protein n=1 Tax=Azohydromonas aeria TaxID=2590212 RepID=UPI0012FA20FB|nr:aliphatic sulfonate ABC transporter substrate-binding protein [Azohydromonas aeria]